VTDRPYVRQRATIQLATRARARGDAAEAKRLQAEGDALPLDSFWHDPLIVELNELRAGRRGRELRIELLENSGRFSDAAEVYLQQAARAPAAPAFTGAGVNLARIGEFERAQESLDRALELDPKNTQAQYTMALVLFTRAERAKGENTDNEQVPAWFKKVVVHAKRATELKPDHAQAYLFWGLALKHLGDPAAAVDPLKKGLACRPDLFELQLSMGEVLAATGSAGDARTHLKRAQLIRPDDPRPAEVLATLPAENK
jgi:tetratricopeptide (TPR) repeat protein